MEIGFGNIPGAISICRFAILACIIRNFDRFSYKLGNILVTTVTIFAVNIMGDNDLRLELSDRINDISKTLVMLELSFRLFQGLRIIIIELSKLRIVIHTHCPDTVKQLVISVRLCLEEISEVCDLNSCSIFVGVDRDHTSKEQYLIVRMGGDKEDVRSFPGRLPLLYEIRKFTGRKSKDICYCCPTIRDRDRCGIGRAG